MSNPLNICVLVVDDDPIVRFIHTTLVNSLDPSISCYEAQNGKDALRVIQLSDFPDLDVILLDLNMPLMNGFEFIEAFKKLESKHLPKIVVVSSSLDVDDQARCQSLGVKQFVNKPLSIDYLQTLIN